MSEELEQAVTAESLDGSTEQPNAEAAPVETPEVDEETLKEAKRQGWVPQEEFRGRENDWVDAETFVKRGREILPIVRKNNEKLLKELKEAKAAAEEAKTVAKEFQKFQKEQYERKEKELVAQIEQLRIARREAISSGDGERVDELEQTQDLLKEELQQTRAAANAPTSQPQQENKPDPALQAWLEKNDWFGNDRRTTGIGWWTGCGRAATRLIWPIRPKSNSTAVLSMLMISMTHFIWRSCSA